VTTSPLTVEMVTTRAGFDALAASWEDLLRAQGEESPFLSPDWYRCCLDAAPDREIRTLAVRSGATLVGIAPLWLGSIPARGIAARALTFISSSETAQNDLVLAPESRREVLQALLRQFLRARPADWDAVALGQWPEESPNLQEYARLIEEGHTRSLSATSSAVPYVPVEGDWESFWSSRSYLFRKSRRGILNRMGRVGDVTVECLAGVRAGEGFAAYRHVAERSWKHREGLSLSSRPELARFFESLTEAAGRRGWLMVWVVSLRGEPIAAEYNLASGGRVHALRADYAEEYGSHSPGAYLEYHIIKHLFENGYREYSTGPGRDTYKARWTEHERINRSITVCRATPRGLALWAVEDIAVPGLRRMRSALGGGDREQAT
jgi:CelD/BcsL family acetyltransferase involved in cellulose biosynthesis